MPAILRQNSFRFAAKCIPFCGKMEINGTTSDKKKVKKTERKGTFSIIFRTFALSIGVKTENKRPTRPPYNTET